MHSLVGAIPFTMCKLAARVQRAFYRWLIKLTLSCTVLPIREADILTVIPSGHTMSQYAVQGPTNQFAMAPISSLASATSSSLNTSDNAA